MKILIKPFEEKDLEQVKALIMECFPTIGIPNIKYQEEEKHFTLVVQTENKIIGHVRIDEIYDNIRDRSHYLLDYMCIKRIPKSWNWLKTTRTCYQNSQRKEDQLLRINLKKRAS